MKIELKKLTDVLDVGWYYVKIDGVTHHCSQSLEEAQAAYKEICEKARFPRVEVLESFEIPERKLP